MSSAAKDPAAPPEKSRGHRRIAWAAAAVVLVTLAAYHNSGRGEFVFDDQSSILGNTSIRHLWPPRWMQAPADAGVSGRPLANFTFALNYAVSRLGVRSYHAVNLAIHILTALVLFGAVRRTLLLPKLRERFGRDSSWLAAAVAGLWAVHPLTTIVVNYLSQRVEGLMALFYLTALYGFIRSTASSSRGWPVLAFGACLLGMASKETMVTAPVMILLYDRTFVAGTFRAAWHQRGRLHLALAATWCALASLMAHAHLAQRGIGFDLGISSLHYALNECRAVLLYLKLALWPHPLVFDYGWDFVTGVRTIFPSMLGVATLAIATLFALWRRPLPGFVGAWFLGLLAPSSSVIPIIQQPIAENRVYLPLAAAAVTAVLGLYQLGGRRGLWACGAIALGLGCITTQRNSDYRTEIALWEDTVAKRPENPRAQANLAAALLRGGRTSEAATHLESALQLKPDYPEAHNNFGAALVRSGQLPKAIAHYRAALALDPAFADAHCNLGEALSLAGDLTGAIAHFESALQLNPDHAKAHNNLSVALLQAGRVPEAIAHGEAARQLDPDFPEAHYNLGNALARSGRAEESMIQFEDALRLDPDFARAHNNLGAMLLRADRVPEAKAHFEAALRINPDYAEARRNLEQVERRMKPIP